MTGPLPETIIALQARPGSRARRQIHPAFRVSRAATPRKRPAKAAPLDLPHEATLAQAVRAIVSNGIRHLAQNRTPTLARNSEGLHQMRVAIRRLRSALVLFERHIEPRSSARYEEILQSLGRTFGEARDWDVLIEETLPALVGDMDAEQSIEPLLAAARAEREKAHNIADQAIEDPAFGDFLLSLATWAENDLWIRAGHEAEARGKARKLAPPLLHKLDQKAKRRARDAGEDDAALHALRKTVKKLRYGADYLSELYADKAVKRFRKACEELQEVLGVINDTWTADRLAANLAQSERPDLIPALSLMANWNEKRRVEASRRYEPAWEIFAAAPRFWE